MQKRIFDYLGLGLILIIPIATFIGKAVIDINLSLIAVIFLIKIIVEKDYSVFNQKWFKILLVFWVYLVFISLFAKYPEIAFKRSIPWIRFPVFALALSQWVFKERTNVILFFKSLLLTLIFIYFDSFWQIVTGTDLFGVNAGMTGDDKSALLITAFLKDHILGFHITFLAFPLLIYMFDRALSKELSYRKKILYIVFIGITFVIVTFSGDRMAWLLMCFGILITLLFYQNYRRYIIYVMVIGVLGLASIFFIKPEVFNRQIVMTYNDLSNFWSSSYGLNFKNGYAVGKTSPIIGVGAKHYRYILQEDICGIPHDMTMPMEEVRKICPGHYTHPHNFYVEIFAEAGIIGLLIFLYFLYEIYRNLYKERKLLNKNPILFGAALTFFLRFWPIASSSSFYAAWTVSSGWLMVGLLYAIIQIDKDGNIKIWNDGNKRA